MPIYWNRIRASPPKNLVDRVVALLDTRFAFSILVIIMSVIVFLLILYTEYEYYVTGRFRGVGSGTKSENEEISDVRPSEISMTIKREEPTADTP